MAEAGAVPSVGSVGDSYDNAWTETIIGLVQDRSDPTPRSLANLGGSRLCHLETGGRVFNHRRLVEPTSNIPLGNWKWPMIANLKGQPWRRDSSKPVSGQSGAVQCDLG
ncbi:protein of unknown function (plasmid) [Candidatus Methylocalor cossyra]|uniref:Transposase n=1 Tax=Candidatus Methylocalor cossyra TaxID=3108543 RepID=A0ABP1CG08_9GAMM